VPTGVKEALLNIKLRPGIAVSGARGAGGGII
jgi:hypothetical protein